MCVIGSCVSSHVTSFHLGSGKKLRLTFHISVTEIKFHFIWCHEQTGFLSTPSETFSVESVHFMLIIQLWNDSDVQLQVHEIARKLSIKKINVYYTRKINFSNSILRGFFPRVIIVQNLTVNGINICIFFTKNCFVLYFNTKIYVCCDRFLIVWRSYNQYIYI
jgi:hypothetical protein